MPSRSPTAQALIDVTGPILATRYSLGRVLYEGAAAIVFEAEDLRTGRRVAAKLLQNLDPNAGPHTLAREVRAAAIVHPNVCAVTDFGIQADVPFIVLELLEGETLAAAIEASGKLGFAHAIAIFIELLCALEATHRAGLVHRDVKPSNVFLVKRDGCDPTVKLIDFGVALRMGRRSKPLAGTPAYMAPEQAKSEPLTGRADLFALGVALFQALTGRRPYSARTYEALLAAHSEPVPDVRTFREDCPEELALVIARATSLDPNERFESALEMQEALAAITIAEEDDGWDYPTTHVPPSRPRTDSCTRIAIPQPLEATGETTIVTYAPLTKRL